MGAWGSGTFENDTACDFAAEIAESSDLNKVQAAVDRDRKAGSSHLEASDAEEALAAADIIARLRGNAGTTSAYTEGIDKWAKTLALTPSAELGGNARRAVNRILMPPSELLELSEDTDDLDSWKSAVNDLLRRL